MSYPSGVAFDQLKSNSSYNPSYAYGQSKLSLIYFIRELSSRLKNTGASAYSVYPGLVSESIFTEKAWVYGHNSFASMTAYSGAFTVVNILIIFQ